MTKYTISNLPATDELIGDRMTFLIHAQLEHLNSIAFDTFSDDSIEYFANASELLALIANAAMMPYTLDEFLADQYNPDDFNIDAICPLLEQLKPLPDD